MKRYLLFAGESYYPFGGWEDFRDSFDSITEATEAAGKLGSDWWHVVDSVTGQIVEQGESEG